jgi:homoserine dehydrogenase
MKKRLKLGLFGFGCVGQGLYHVLQQTHGVKADIKRIGVKDRNKARPLPAELFTFDPADIINDPEIDVVVELIDDAATAFKLVKRSLENGKAVVTANKKMLAENLEEIYQLQRRHNRPVLYEGAVCGSIPIIRNLEEYYDNDLLESIEGIFNGSTNYILTKIFDERQNYAQALAQAQQLGFAESNPALDVQAFDPKFKLVIAIAHTFGVFVNPDQIIRFGIDRISEVELKYARQNHYTIKLIARAFKEGNRVFALVAPQYLEAGHPLATVRNEYNAVQVQSAFAERQWFVGKGAGSHPTGSAVLSDISALTYDYRYEYKKRQEGTSLQFSNHAVADVLVSFVTENAVTPNDFETFTGGYRGNGHRFLTGQVRLEKIRQWHAVPEVNVILAPGTQLRSLELPEKETVAPALA